MYCQNCGTKNSDQAEFCTNCGSKLGGKAKNNLVGYSDKINDPFFKKYVKNTSFYRKIFGFGLALILTIGFYIYGEFSDQMDNPQAVLIGLGIGLVYSFIVFKISKPSQEPSWEGVVVDKKTNRRRRRIKENSGYRYQDYTEYTVYFEGPNDEVHEITDENNDLLYNYYQKGDSVKYHGFLKTIEKYDKSKDDIIFCAACADINDIKDNHCHRCNAPLLK